MLDTSAARSARPLSFEHFTLANSLLNMAADASGIRRTLIKYGGREPRLARLRWAVMYALRSVTGDHRWSYPRIATFFLMDHSTVHHGVRQCERMLKVDEEYSTFVASLVERARRG